jgi:hypothetical protein
MVHISSTPIIKKIGKIKKKINPKPGNSYGYQTLSRARRNNCTTFKQFCGIFIHRYFAPTRIPH